MDGPSSSTRFGTFYIKTFAITNLDVVTTYLDTYIIKYGGSYGGEETRISSHKTVHANLYISITAIRQLIGKMPLSDKNVSDPDSEASGSQTGEGKVPILCASSISSITAMSTVVKNVPFSSKLIMEVGQLNKNWKRFKMAWPNYLISSYMKFQPAEVPAATLNCCLA